MEREQLEHLIRAAAQVTHEYEFIIVGSQSILGTPLSQCPKKLDHDTPHRPPRQRHPVRDFPLELPTLTTVGAPHQGLVWLVKHRHTNLSTNQVPQHRPRRLARMARGALLGLLRRPFTQPL